MLALRGLCEGFARGAVIGHPTKDVHPEPAEGLFSYSPFLAGQCKIISVHVGHLPVPKSLAAKSSVSLTSKLIETIGLQVLHFGHLRKTGGRGSYRLVQTGRILDRLGREDS